MRDVSLRLSRSKRNRVVSATALTGVVALVAALAPTSAFATGSDHTGGASDSRAARSPLASGSGSAAHAGTTRGDKLADYDARTDPLVRTAVQRHAAALAATPSARGFRKTLGAEGIFALDGLTGTPRSVGRTDGFLTPRSSAKPEAIVRAYLKKNAATFGLSAKDIDRLTLRQDYRDVSGTHHLSFQQSVQGVPVFGNGVKANLTGDGRLISVQGSPVASLPTSLPGIAAPKLSAGQARNAAIRDAFGSPKAAASSVAPGRQRATTFADGDRAQLVVFQTTSGPRVAWQTITSPSKSQMFLHVRDAETGRLLFRRDLVQRDSADVIDYYPGAARGGTFHTVLLPSAWLPKNSPRLAGNVAHVYADVNDDDVAQGTEETRPASRGSFDFPLQAFDIGAQCASYVCTWDPAKPNSWKANKDGSSAQLYYFLGKYHDHLRAEPIGFTREAGNFEAVDDDAVQGENLDGANTAKGLPDANHIDNANFATPPDGIPPRMQMYLWHQPGTDDPFVPADGAYDASIVYHEYTHGLSNRLVVDADGVSTLGNIQAGSMGEAWSDWYAMDFLADEGYVVDKPGDGDVRIGEWVGGGQDLIRTQPIDCSVGSTSPKCPGTSTAGSGGYTYGDFGKVSGSPEVHADGEIWVETLWQLRSKIGSRLAESLITRAMELSPANPSYLDMRNSILQADEVVNHGAAHKVIWSTFASRGMGYFAAAYDGDDTAPVEDFSLPPRPGTPTGSLTGKVLDSDGNAPLEGAVVAFGGHNSGFGGDYSAVTDAKGSYTISGIYAGTYPKVFANAPGYDRGTATVSVSNGANTRNWTLRRDWAATSGGSKVTDFNGVDFTADGCGPPSLFDQSEGSGWSSDAVVTSGTAIEPRHAVLQLPKAVNISALEIDPSNTCGDSGSASTGDFKVETSPDGKTWTTAATGHFTPSDRSRMNVVKLTAGSDNVAYVRYTMLGTQVGDLGGSCPGNFSGCDWVDSSELAIYGSAAVSSAGSSRLPKPGPVALGVASPAALWGTTG